MSLAHSKSFTAKPFQRFSQQISSAFSIHRCKPSRNYSDRKYQVKGWSHKEKWSSNFRWLNALKKKKIMVFLLRDNSGEKTLTAHTARRTFRRLILPRLHGSSPFVATFSRLHKKFCVLVLRSFPAHPAPFELCTWLIGTVCLLRPVIHWSVHWDAMHCNTHLLDDFLFYDSILCVTGDHELMF